MYHVTAASSSPKKSWSCWKPAPAGGHPGQPSPEKSSPRTQRSAATAHTGAPSATMSASVTRTAEESGKRRGVLCIWSPLLGSSVSQAEAPAPTSGGRSSQFHCSAIASVCQGRRWCSLPPRPRPRSLVHPRWPEPAGCPAEGVRPRVLPCECLAHLLGCRVHLSRLDVVPQESPARWRRQPTAVSRTHVEVSADGRM